MSLRIEGLSGRPPEVTTGYRMQTESSSNHPAMVAAKKQDAYTVAFDVDTNAADADFFYMKNDSNRNLIIHRIMLFSPTLDLDILVKTGVTGSTTSGVALTPYNLYTGGRSADCTCEERAGDLALTGGNIIDRVWTNKDFEGGHRAWDYPSGIILPPNTAMILNTVLDPTADIDCTIHFYFEDIE